MKLVHLYFIFIESVILIQSLAFTPFRFRSIPLFRQCETPILNHGTVRLRQRGKLIRYMCLPTYTLIGDKYSTCIQGHWENPVPMCIKPGCYTISPPENGFTAVDKNGALSMLFCKPGYSVSGSQQTFCDGTKWDRSLGSCRETQTGPQTSCDFEVSSICDWVSDPSHDFEWIRKNGYTYLKRMENGPSHDHTIGIPLEGHYMMAHVMNQVDNAKARLISPIYSAKASQNACFRLYYHMFGSSPGMLRVYVKPESVEIADILDNPKYLFMEKYTSFINAWLEAVSDIDRYDEDFQIVIEATIASTLISRNNIAIDDIALLNDADCTNEETKSTIVQQEEGGIIDVQSCVNRCQETGPYSTNVTEEVKIANKTGILLHCDCFDGCEDLKSCCLDYRSVCVFDVSTVDSTNMELITTSNPVSNIVTSIPLIISTVIQTTENSITTKIIPITQKTSTSPTSSTKQATQTTPTIPTTQKTPSTLPLTIKTTMKSTSAKSPFTTTQKLLSTSTTTTKYIPPFTKLSTTIKPTTTKMRPTPSTPKKNIPTIVTAATTMTIFSSTVMETSVIVPSQNGKGGNDDWHSISDSPDIDPLPKNLMYMLGLTLIIGLISLISFKLLRKYSNGTMNCRNNLKRCSVDASDEVRFLTAEEQLDFAVQTEFSIKK